MKTREALRPREPAYEAVAAAAREAQGGEPSVRRPTCTYFGGVISFALNFRATKRGRFKTPCPLSNARVFNEFSCTVFLRRVTGAAWFKQSYNTSLFRTRFDSPPPRARVQLPYYLSLPHFLASDGRPTTLSTTRSTTPATGCITCAAMPAAGARGCGRVGARASARLNSSYSGVR